MKKKLIALAIAGAMTAPMAAMAETSLYGQLNMELQSWDGNLQTNSYGSRLGFKGSEDLGNGLKAIYQIEGGLNISLNGGNGNISGRNSFLGLAGDFGTVILGRHDHPYKLATLAFRPMGDTMADRAGFHADQFLRTDGVLAYVSPSMGGMTVAAAVVPTHKVTGSDDLAYSVMASYGAGPILVNVAYDAVEDAGADNVMMAGVRYDFGMGTVGVMYESFDLADDTHITVPVTFKIGGTSYVRAMVKMRDNADSTDFAVQAGTNMSKRTEAYALVATVNDNDMNAFSVGLRHKF